MRRWCTDWISAFAATLLMIGAPASAQDAALPEAVRAWKEAAAAIDAISFELESDEIGDGASSAKFSGSCTLIRAEAGGWQMHLSGELQEAEESRRVLIVYDGVSARSVRDADRVVIEKTIVDLDELRSFLSGQGVGQVMPWEIMEGVTTEGAFVADAAEAANGVECEVITIPPAPEAAGDSVFKPKGLRMRIGKEDHVPRTIERMRSQMTPQGEAILTRVVRIIEPKVGAAAQRRAFVIDAPEGYRVRVEKKQRRIVKKESPNSPAPRNELLAVGDAAPDWTLQDATGSQVSLGGLKGSVVVMDFWATWCGPCKAAMPHVQQLHEDYEAKGVKVFGVNCWERADAKAFMTKAKYTYGLLMNGDQVAQAYKVTGIPTFYVIDQQGKIAFTAVGMPNDAALRATIDALLSK